MRLFGRFALTLGDVSLALFIASTALVGPSNSTDFLGLLDSPISRHVIQAIRAPLTINLL